MTVNLNASLTQGFGITSDTSGVLTFQSNAAETMRIDTLGNVGIGTTSPGYPLQVKTGSSNMNTVTMINDATQNLSALGFVQAGSTTLAYTSIHGDGRATGYMAFKTNDTERMRIDSNGSVGIGTTAPASKLNLQGSSLNWTTYSVSGTNKAFIGVDNGTPEIIVGATAGDMVIRTQQSMLFGGSGGGYYGKFDTSGNFLVGATSVGVGKLASYTSSNTLAAADFRSTASGDVGNRSIYISKFDNNSTTSQIFIQFAINNAAAGSGQINANGANSAAFGSYSDKQLKENIVDLPSQIENICSLRPVEFDYKDGSGHQIGFVAQEMQEVYPDVVGVGADDMLTITGWSKTEARLVKAIQELSAKVDSQASEIAALKAKVGA